MARYMTRTLHWATISCLLMLIPVQGATVSPCETDGFVEVLEKTLTELSCTGLNAQEIATWKVTSRNIGLEIMLGSCPPSPADCDMKYSPYITPKRTSADRSTLTIDTNQTPNVINLAQLAKIGPLSIGCSTSNTCVLDFVQPANVESCNVLARGTGKGAQLTVSCRITRAYSARNKYSCQLFEIANAVDVAVGQEAALQTVPLNNGDVSGTCKFTVQKTTDSDHRYAVVIKPGRKRVIPTTRVLPAKLPPPTVTMDFNSLNDMQLECNIKDVTGGDFQFKVDWLKNDELISTRVLEPGKLSSKLRVERNSFDNQQTYRCAISACYDNECSDSSTSVIYRPEVQLLNDGIIQIEEGGHSAPLYFQATAHPAVLCVVNGYQPDCKITLRFTIDDRPPRTCVSPPGQTIPQLLLPFTGQLPCSYTVTSQNWNIKGKLELVANQDGFFGEGTTTSGLTLTVTMEDFNKRADTQSIIQPIKVVDKDRKEVVCTSLNDPHMTTADKKPYENQNDGEFILYRHKTEPYEVRAFFKRCNNQYPQARCNCGAAVIVGDNVVHLEGCRPGGVISEKLYTRNGIQPGLSVRKYTTGDVRYELILPNGARLVMKPGHQNFVNLWFYPSPLDFGNMLGLCGTYDGNSENDFHLKDGRSTDVRGFITEWRVPEEDSIFNGMCQTAARNVGVQINQQYARCEVGNTNSYVLPGPGLSCRQLPENNRAVDITTTLGQNAGQLPRCGPIIDPFPQEPIHIIDQNDFEWPPGWNEEKARKHCVDTLRGSPVAQICQKIVQAENVDPAKINACVFDIKMSGEGAWAVELVKDHQQNCLHQAENNNLLQQETGLTNEDIQKIINQLTDDKPKCPEGWSVGPANSCYFISNTKSNFYFAGAQCATEGGYQVEINDSKENDFITDFLKLSVSQDAWIGLRDFKKNGQFLFASQLAIPTYFNWQPNRPNLGQGQDCAYISITGQWSNDNCKSNDKYTVCEQQLR